MKKGFTLSEVMLVLSVIGVIAALTIPGVVQNTQNKQTVTKLKKIYSTISQSAQMLMVDNDGTLEGNYFSGSSNNNTLNAFASKMTLIKTCMTGVAGCWYTTPITQKNGNLWSSNPDNSGARGVLADGSLLIFNDYSGDCTYNQGSGPLQNSLCGDIYVDINGSQNPNQWSRDIFRFWITKNGVYPAGLFNDGNDCGTGSNYGYGCAAKIIQENNMNY